MTGRAKYREGFGPFAGGRHPRALRRSRRRQEGHGARRRRHHRRAGAGRRRRRARTARIPRVAPRHRRRATARSSCSTKCRPASAAPARFLARRARRRRARRDRARQGSRRRLSDRRHALPREACRRAPAGHARVHLRRQPARVRRGARRARRARRREARRGRARRRASISSRALAALAPATAISSSPSAARGLLRAVPLKAGSIRAPCSGTLRERGVLLTIAGDRALRFCPAAHRHRGRARRGRDRPRRSAHRSRHRPQRRASRRGSTHEARFPLPLRSRAGRHRAPARRCRRASTRCAAQPEHPRPLAGRSAALLFDKASTRTRVSLEIAVVELGGHPVVITAQGSQMGRGEPPADTARVLSRYVDVITYRTFESSRLIELARAVERAGRSTRSPTTPTLCSCSPDLYTVRSNRGKPRRPRYAWVGDGNNMARSWIEAARLLGFELAIACPQGFEPPPRRSRAAPTRRGEGHRGRAIPRAACEGADVISTDVWASMGQEDEAEPRAEGVRGLLRDEPARRRARRRTWSCCIASPRTAAKRSTPMLSTDRAASSGIKPRLGCTRQGGPRRGRSGKP